MLKLRANFLNEHLKFAVMLRRDVGEHKEQRIQVFEVFGKITTPLDIVHICEVDFRFLATDESRILALVKVEAAFKIEIVNVGMSAVERVDGVNGRLNEVFDAVERQTERVYRTLQTFEQVNAHKFADASFTPFA